MPAINLNFQKSVFSPTLFPLLFDYSHRFEFYKGSAGSGKSYFITQKLIIRCCREQIRVLVCRRYGTTIRNTCFALFKEILKKWQLLPYVKIRETDFNIQFPNGSEIIFTGLDEETKLLSLNNIGCIFIEEVFEVPKDMVEQLNLRMRGDTKQQQILAAFNPISRNHWLYNFCVEQPPQSFLFSETTYKDNPFLPHEYVSALEEMIVRNPAKAKVYVFGEWGINNDLLVFKNWKVEDFDEMALAASGLEVKVGLDEGFTDATAIVQSLYDKANGKIYVYSSWYQQGAQLDNIAAALTQLNVGKSIIWCDSAAPRLIDYLRSKGFAAKPCIKGSGSVEARISFLQNHEIIIKPNNKEVITEFENFSYMKDRMGNLTDKTTHEWSHTIDALGYAYSNIYRGNKLATFDKAALGL